MMAVLDHLAQQRIVITVLDGITKTLGHILSLGELGAGHDAAVQEILGDDLLFVYMPIEVTREGENLRLVEIGDGREGAVHVAVQSRVAECYLGLVTVIGENEPVLGGKPGEHVGAAYSSL